MITNVSPHHSNCFECIAFSPPETRFALAEYPANLRSKIQDAGSKI
jgi:hypothetical protein